MRVLECLYSFAEVALSPWMILIPVAAIIAYMILYPLILRKQQKMIQEMISSGIRTCGGICEYRSVVGKD